MKKLIVIMIAFILVGCGTDINVWELDKGNTFCADKGKLNQIVVGGAYKTKMICSNGEFVYTSK